MNWLCRLGWHDPAAPVHWESGYYVARCRRCGRDLLRTFRGSWRWRQDVMVRRHDRLPLEEARDEAGAVSSPTEPARGWKSQIAAASEPSFEKSCGDQGAGGSARAAPQREADSRSDDADASTPPPRGGKDVQVAAAGVSAAGALLLLCGLIMGAALTMAGSWLLPPRERAAPAAVHPAPASVPAATTPQPFESAIVAVREGPCRSVRSRGRWRADRNSRALQLRIEEEDGHWLTLSRAGTPCWVLVSGRRR
jgi:hypothetical protein